MRHPEANPGGRSRGGAARGLAFGCTTFPFGKASSKRRPAKKLTVVAGKHGTRGSLFANPIKPPSVPNRAAPDTAPVAFSVIFPVGASRREPRKAEERTGRPRRHSSRRRSRRSGSGRRRTRLHRSDWRLHGRRFPHRARCYAHAP
jgi:hypothetical protein